MRVLLGPPGSGKTTKVLAEFCQAARARHARLVVPTATMAAHLQHTLARRGEPIAPSSITTLARFAAALSPGAPAADSATLALLVEQQLPNHPDLFPASHDTAGLPAAIAAAIEELAGAGCHADQWDALSNLERNFDPAFGRLCRGVEQALSGAGFRLRATLFEDAAARVRQQGAGVDEIWFDGFSHFSKTELALLEALGSRARLTLTLPEWKGVEELIRQLGKDGARIERLQLKRAAPAIHRIHAATREREAEEIALRILDEHGRGRRWREMGIVLRNEAAYVPLLERTLYRAGIPYRAYFGVPLRSEPATSFLGRFVAAVTSRWDGEQTIDLLRHPLCRAHGALSGRAWIGALRALPFQGLGELEAISRSAARLLRPFEDWPERRLPPAEWAQQLSNLASLLEPPPANGTVTPEQLRALRLTAAGFRAILEAASSFASLFPDDHLLLCDFWNPVKDALAAARIYPADSRRDVVHILDVQEARQWELPVVFVCGLLEGEFPRRPGPDPLLPEHLRLTLHRHGFPVRMRADREEEERFHFEIARTRATEKLFLSWPSANEKGDPTLPAFVLESPGLGQENVLPARRLRVRPAREPRHAPRPSLQSVAALDSMRVIHSSLAATAIESFLQCPFQFFARYTLGLQPLPPRPAERIDQLWLGSLAHQILAEWHKRRCDIATLVDEFWDRELHRSRLTETHRSILARAAMKRSLTAYAADPRLQDGWELRLEEELELHESDVVIRGRADRVDVSPDGDCIVYDFKYSGAQSICSREDISVQGGLYAEALARNENLRPAGIFFIALKDDGKRTGAGDPKQAREKINEALEKTRTAIERIYSGRIDVAPALGDLCRWCEFLDACRWQELAPARAAGGEEEG
ncbi:MAG: PD-(D/E)XK nuclease family protein [Bryobacteraceae bacterium]